MDKCPNAGDDHDGESFELERSGCKRCVKRNSVCNWAKARLKNGKATCLKAFADMKTTASKLSMDSVGVSSGTFKAQ